MKTLITVALLFFCSTVAAENQVLYVSDLNEITFRTGPGIDHKITAMLKSGKALYPMETNGDWTNVRLDDGREGWVLSRFVTPTLPCRYQLDTVEKNFHLLKSQFEALSQENQVNQEEVQSLRKALESCEAERAETRQAYDKLKSDSKEFFNLKTRYEKATRSLTEKTNENKTLQKELTKLQLNQQIKWFLIGAGVLFVGFILGFSSKRQRRRSSLL